MMPYVWTRLENVLGGARRVGTVTGATGDVQSIVSHVQVLSMTPVTTVRLEGKCPMTDHIKHTKLKSEINGFKKVSCFHVYM